MRYKIVRFESPGLVLKSRLQRPFTVTYGELLTAERLRRARGLRLHTRTTEPIRIAVTRGCVSIVEETLRRNGVRIVDCWGCSLTPTLADFEELLDQEPPHVRQSYDDA